MSKISKKTLEILEKAAYLKTAPSKYEMTNLEIERRHLYRQHVVEDLDIAEYVILRLIGMVNNSSNYDEDQIFNALTGALYLLDSIKLLPSGRTKYSVSKLSKKENNVLAETLNAAYWVISLFKELSDNDFVDELYRELFKEEDIDYVIDIFKML